MTRASGIVAAALWLAACGGSAAEGGVGGAPSGRQPLAHVDWPSRPERVAHDDPTLGHVVLLRARVGDALMTLTTSRRSAYELPDEDVLDTLRTGIVLSSAGPRIVGGGSRATLGHVECPSRGLTVRLQDPAQTIWADRYVCPDFVFTVTVSRDDGGAPSDDAVAAFLASATR